MDVPLDEPRYNALFSGDTSSNGFIVDEIKEFRVTLEDAGLSADDRQFALHAT